MLIKRDMSASEISEKLKINGGQLHHHLDELLKAHYIRKINRGHYSIDMDGWRALFTVMQLGHCMRVKAPELRKLRKLKKNAGLKRNFYKIAAKFHLQVIFSIVMPEVCLFRQI